MILWIIASITAAVLTLVLHEAAHALVIKALGGTVHMFKPWPHFHDFKLYFGRVSYTLDNHSSMNYVHIAPAIKSIILFVLYLFLAPVWCLFLIVFATCELIDLLLWLKGYIFGPERTDGRKFRRNL